MNDFLLFSVLGLLFTHELDAIRHHEWRLFPGLNRLRDDQGYVVFTLIHVPLFALLIALAAQPVSARGSFEVGVHAFALIHAGLHLGFRRHPAYGFRGWVSNGLIAGAALVGVAGLIGRL